MFSWDDLKFFLAFARGGSTLAAAKALGVNQSTVHRRLTELERQLGHRLIERHLTGYRLTELGEELQPHIERVEEAARAVERNLASIHKEPTGTVRVTCSPTVGERLKRTRLFDTFNVRFPGLKIELALSDRYLDLSKGEADIAIREGRVIEDESLVGRKIAEGVWGVYASRSYIERHGRPKQAEDIGRHCVVRCEGTIVNHPAAQWLRAIAPNATVAACSESWPGLVLAVKSGAGLAPLSVALGDRESELVRVIDISGLVTHFHLLVHRDMQHTPRVRAFFDFVISEIKAFRAALLGRADPEDDKGNSVAG